MKLKNILPLFICIFPFLITAQNPIVPKDPWKNTREGNEYYKRTNYTEAERKYNEALTTDTSKVVANYNLGNALYKQKKYPEAGKAYADGLGTTAKDSLNRGWYNLGNAMLMEKKYSESINAYKEALRNNPADENARYNLAYAQKMLKNQQQKDQQQNGGDSGENKDDKQQQKDQDKQDKQDKKQDDKKKDDAKKDQPDPKKQPMSPQEAKKMLDALKNEEQKTRQRINKNGNGTEYRRSKDKDW